MNNYEIFKSFTTFSKKVKREMDLRTVDLGINGLQSCIIRYLVNNEKVYQKDFEESFNVRKSSISSVLDNMEKSNLIARVSDESDLRKKQIVLTEEGKSMHLKVAKILNELLDEIFIDLTKEDVENFKVFFSKIEQKIERF